MALHSDGNPSAAKLVAPPQPQDCRKELLLVIAHMLLKHVSLSSGKPPANDDDFAVGKKPVLRKRAGFSSFEEAIAPKLRCSFFTDQLGHSPRG